MILYVVFDTSSKYANVFCTQSFSLQLVITYTLPSKCVALELISALNNTCYSLKRDFQVNFVERNRPQNHNKRSNGKIFRLQEHKYQFFKFFKYCG